MGVGFCGGINGIALDYLSILKDEMFTPMEKNQEKGIDSVVNFMKEYGLSREDWNSVSELGIGYISPENRPIKIATKVKSAFTRQCNRELANYAKTNSLSGKGTKAPKLKLNQQGDPIDSNNQQSQNDSDDDNDDRDEKEKEKDSLKKDGLIKVKQSKGKGKGKSKGKSKTSKTTKSKAKGNKGNKGTKGKGKTKTKTKVSRRK